MGKRIGKREGMIKNKEMVNRGRKWLKTEENKK